MKSDVQNADSSGVVLLFTPYLSPAPEGVYPDTDNVRLKVSEGQQASYII